MKAISRLAGKAPHRRREPIDATLSRSDHSREDRWWHDSWLACFASSRRSRRCFTQRRRGAQRRREQLSARGSMHECSIFSPFTTPNRKTLGSALRHRGGACLPRLCVTFGCATYRIAQRPWRARILPS